MSVSHQDLVRRGDALKQVFAANREMLTNLDADVGDGEYGDSMDRG